MYIKNIYSFSDIPDFLYFLAAILEFWHYYLSDHAKIWYDNVLFHNKQLLFFMYIKIIYSFPDIPDFLYFLAAILVSMAAILDFQNFKILLSACISRAVRGHTCQISWSCDFKPLRYSDIGDFWKSKMAAKENWKSKFHLDVAHLDTLEVLHVKFRDRATSNFGY